jgi:hypothetical protein
MVSRFNLDPDFQPKGMKMLLLSGKPVTQNLTKKVEPLTQPGKGLKSPGRAFFSSKSLNFALSNTA